MNRLKEAERILDEWDGNMEDQGHALLLLPLRNKGVPQRPG